MTKGLKEGLPASTLARLTATQKLILKTCDEVSELLMAKNKAYGDSAIKPLNVAAAGSALELIAIRVDDKLSRLRNGGGLAKALTQTSSEDTVMDLIGYLVLAKVASASPKSNKGDEGDDKRTPIVTS